MEPGAPSDKTRATPCGPAAPSNRSRPMISVLRADSRGDSLRRDSRESMRSFFFAAFPTLIYKLKGNSWRFPGSADQPGDSRTQGTRTKVLCLTKTTSNQPWAGPCSPVEEERWLAARPVCQPSIITWWVRLRPEQRGMPSCTDTN